ncbi:DUF1269 domain-containing protein [Nocardioides euryhalodurans]|uniref:DUF1269 domain-containing protein n=1 Tax=Nocardioides euryhalodurans TaxID=2518370 RepID=A0A4P7GQA7_9ACTN|nr:DUF1269 domain-containing protein [Nocardioides euryhalodurans]
MGPISYLVVEFPGARMTGEGLQELVRLTEQGTVRVLDLAFVMKGADGTVTALDISDIDGDGELDLMVFEGASSDLLGPDDLEEAGGALAADSAAAVLLFENTWAAPMVSALRRSGAELVAAGYVPHDQLTEALDLAEAAG